MLEREIFIDALQENNASRRAVLLDRACNGDAELRLRVEQLLVEHERQESFVLDRPQVELGLDATIAQRSTSSVGMQIGPYKLLQQIGEGGMGVVYLAEQSQPVRRSVAFKIIKPGMDTKQVIARFEAERQALALMDHPNIAKVLDTGTSNSGQPYFVMELVKGVPITEYCDAHQLTLRERLALFVPVCQAVQHAHQKGIIHRDLKPSNVMIAPYDGRPVPKVIDFGVAKATGPRLTEKTMFTEFGSVVGTLEYMSPEQAELNQLDVDTRSDVYSLGVLLYELLTGSTPLERNRLLETALQEVLRVIREVEPPKPSTRLSTTDHLAKIAANRGVQPKDLSGSVRGELDWIVMKALDKDRNRRYDSANSLLRDVERYLADEPVQACPPSLVYRFNKLASRHKVALITTGIVAASLVVATAVSIWQATAARRAEALASSRLVAEQKALHAAQEAEQLAEERLASEQEARRLATAEASKAMAISDLLQEALQSANPDDAKGADYTVRQLLDDMAAGLGHRLKDQPEAEAALRATMGNAFRRLGQYDRAAPQLDAALRLREQVLPADHLDLAQSRYYTAWNLYELQRFEQAELLIRQALAIHEGRELANHETAAMLVLLQLTLLRRDDPRGSELQGQRVVELARLNPDPRIQAEAANAFHNLSWKAIQFDRDPRRAEQLARQAMTLHRQFHGTNHPETAWGLHHLGAALVVQSKWREATACDREAMAIFLRNYDATHVSVQNAMVNLGADLLSIGDQAGLDEHIDDCIEVIRRTMERGPDHALKLIEAFARDLVPYYMAPSDKMTVFVESVAKEHSHLPQAWALRGFCRLHRGDNQGAVDALSRAIELDPTSGDYWSYRSLAHFRCGELQQATNDATEALVKTGNRALAHHYRGEAYRLMKRRELARADHDQAVAIEPKWSMFWHGRARLAVDDRRWGDARRDLGQAWTLPARPDERFRQILTWAQVAIGRVGPLLGGMVTATAR